MDNFRGAKLRDAQCIGCYRKFGTFFQGAFGMFCMDCRSDMGITDARDAELVMQMIEGGLYAPLKQEEGEVFGFGNDGHDDKRRSHAKKEQADPARVAEGLRQACDYKFIEDVTEHGYEKPITYVMAKNGLLEVRHSDLVTIVTRPKEVLGIATELKEGITLNLPKLPFTLLNQTVSFFRGVCKKLNNPSESLVQIWWNRTEKAYHLHVPEQRVTGSSVNHNSTFDRENDGNWYHVMDIHCHGSMGAFWSGTDDHDERRVTTERLFGVIGGILNPIPTWKWRMRTRDAFIDLNVADIWEIPTEQVPFQISRESLFRAISEPNALDKEGRVLLGCPVTLFTEVEIDKTWYDKVNGFSYGGGGHRREGNVTYHGGGRTPYGQQQLPSLRGYIYVAGKEYLVDDNNMTETGFELTRKNNPKHPANNTKQSEK